MKPLIAVSANTSWYVYNFRMNLIKEILRSGYQVMVVSPRDEYAEMLIGEGVSFFDIKIDRCSKNPFKELSTIAQYILCYKKSRPLYVLNFTPKPNIYSSIAASFFGIKSINNISGLGSSLGKANSILGLVARQLYKASQKSAAAVLFQNQEDMDNFISSKIVSPNVCYRIPGSGVDLNRFSFRPKGRGKADISFLFVARLLKDKGVYEFCEAAKVVEDKHKSLNLKFLIAGFLDDGNPNAISSDELEIILKTYPVKYLGKTDNVEALFADASCVVLPSYYNEGVPRVLLEAAASGCPIITTDWPGCRDAIINNVSGYLCEPRSIESLVACMSRFLLLTESEKNCMGTSGRQFMEAHYSETIVINKYLNLIGKR